MNVENTIKSLLYKHDCVIVPEFGGFVAKRKPATFHPMDYTFYPPSKKIGFNSNLKNTDGLLANSLAKNLSLSYEEATEMIASKVADWYKELELGNAVHLTDIGIFTIVNNHVTFEAVENQNFSIENFGLNSLKGKYILREEIKTEQTTHQASNSWLSYVAAIGFALIVGGSSYFANEKLVQPQLSSVFPLLNDNETIEVEPAPIAPKIRLNTSSNESVVDKVKEDIVTKTTDASALVEDTFIATEEETLDLSVKPYQVIGGSFKVYARAMEHQAKLKRKGYDRAIIIGKVGNFYMVAYDTFHSEDEAIAYKRELEKKGYDVFMRP